MLESRLFFSLERPRVGNYAQRIVEYRSETEKDPTPALIEYSFFQGNYSVKKCRGGFELEKIYMNNIFEDRGGVINAKFVFPKTYSELIESLNNKKIQERKIIIYPLLERISFRNMFSSFQWNDSKGIEGRIVYQKGGFFTRDRLILKGIQIANEEYLLKENR